MSNPIAMFNKMFFLATARLSDKVIVASMSYNAKKIELGAVKQMLGSLQAMDSGKLYAFAMGEFAWSVLETGGVIYVTATVVDYPSRVAKQCLDECARLFTARVREDLWKTCGENGVMKESTALLQSMCAKYDNLAEMDKVTATLAKVDAVKMQMADNIQEQLKNCMLAEKIEADAQDLQASAGIFRKQANDLKSKMWWKNLKMKLLIFAITITILGVIALIIAAQVGAFEQTDDDSGDGTSGDKADCTTTTNKDGTTTQTGSGCTTTTAPAPAPAPARYMF